MAFWMACAATAEASPLRPSGVVDVHVHLAALPDGNNGCWISPAMLNSWLVHFSLWRMGLRADRPAQVSVTSGQQDYGDPGRLRLALEQGVTVIAAHGMSQGLFFHEKYWDTLADFVRKYPRFYWDASALSLPNRVGMLLRIRRRPELAARMIFGTDYPLPSFAYPALLAGKVSGYLELRGISNPFDRQYRLLEILGLSPKPFPSHGN